MKKEDLCASAPSVAGSIWSAPNGLMLGLMPAHHASPKSSEHAAQSAWGDETVGRGIPDAVASYTHRFSYGVTKLDCSEGGRAAQ